MRRLWSIILLPLAYATALAVPAYPLPVTVRQPDGSTVAIVLHGDEFCHWATDTLGRGMVRGADLWWRVASIPSASERYALRQYSLSRMLPLPGTSTSAPLTKGGGAEASLSRILVIPVQFKDLVFSRTDYKEHLVRKLTEPGYSENGATGSVKDYFEANFPGRTFTFDVTDIVTLAREASYYGTNDESVPSRILYDVNMPILVKEACTAIDSKVDFRNYDRNGDSKIDHLIFVYAGYNEAEGGGSEFIWSHEWDLSTQKFKFDGIYVGLYAAAAELRGASDHNDAGIGTFCHELAHTFGLKDLYDVNYGSGGLCNCLWQTLSLMDYGNYTNSGHTPPYFCAIDRELAGTADIRYLEAGEEVRLEPVHLEGTVCRSDTDTEGEYYLFENRAETIWDRYIGGHGMVIYHIDKSDNTVAGIQSSVRWEENIINTVYGHECADLVEALPDAQSIRQVFFPGQGAVTEFSPATIPAFESWDGNILMLRLSDIRQSGDDITFKVLKDSTERLLTAKNLRVRPYQTDADLSWKSDRSNAVWGIRWKEVGEGILKETQVQKNEYSLTDLEPNKNYQAEVFNIGKYGNGDTTSVMFTTLGYTSSYPVISSLRDIYRVGETLSLKVLNIHEETSSITWYLNGLRADTQEITLSESGTMTVKAVVKYSSDGTSETITKTITVLDDEN